MTRDLTGPALPALVASAVLCLLLAACRTSPVLNAEGHPGTSIAAQEGRFLAEYGAATADFAAFRDGLITNRFLDTIAIRLNDSLRIPRDVILATGHCEAPNASYEPANRRVILCYELFESLSDRFQGIEEAEYLVAGTAVFALMHELGHALIDVLDLPITGREEDAVDQLATVLLLEQGAVGDSLAFGAVGWFATNAEQGELDDLAFADDHGLDRQRVHNILCWIHGRDPDRYADVLTEDWLPSHRRSRCPDEYRRLTDSWRRLMEPHRRGRRP